jgi:hypothetical protein
MKLVLLAITRSLNCPLLTMNGVPGWAGVVVTIVPSSPPNTRQ